MTVSVPLRGLGSWKAYEVIQSALTIASFSPLAGIRFVESACVSVKAEVYQMVSVPLRGLGSWKGRQHDTQHNHHAFGFSPLAGIRFVESF